jgi:hypothetical protein
MVHFQVYFAFHLINAISMAVILIISDRFKRTNTHQICNKSLDFEAATCVDRNY